MTKSLKQIQQENRKFILEAIHGCSYEEALKKELGLGCEVLVQHYVGGLKDKTEVITLDRSHMVCDLTGAFIFTKEYRHPADIIKIIGKPLTFNRVLLAINIFFGGYTGNFYFDEDFVHIAHLDLDGVSFDLTKETLEEQSEETQRAINKILKGE